MAFPTDRPVSRAARFVSDSLTKIVGDLVQRGIWTGHLIDSDVEPG